MTVRILLSLWVLAWFAVPLSAQHKLVDFQRIVTVAAPCPVQQTAAAELAEYVGRMTGKPLAVIGASEWNAKADGLSFFVGDAARLALDADPAPWQHEEYLLRSVPQGLVLAGDDDPKGNPWTARTRAGSLLATYTLLDDHLGVHWFWPGPFGEHVPQGGDATVPVLNIRATPRLLIRSIELGYSTYHTPEFKESARRWSRRNRLAWTRSAVFGHSWFDAFQLRTDESFRAHPDWFALVDGKRRPPQMCTTHPAVLERMVEHVLQGKQDIMNISPSDGGGFCTCERCRALDVPGLLAYDNKSPQLSDRIFTYANEVARRVREQNSERGVGMFAYTFYNRPPAKIAALEPNLYLSFVYQSAGLRDPAALADWRQSVDGWKKLGAKLVIREGWGNHYYLDMPFPQDQLIISNMQEAVRKGFIAAYGEGSKSFATQAPNYWALTRAMWSPERGDVSVMDEFYRSAYGPAASDMRAFFETYQRALDEHWSQRRRLVDTNIIAYANLISSWHLLYTPTVIAEAEAHLKQAEKIVPSGEYAQRIAMHRFGQDYTALMLELIDNYRNLAELGVKLDFFSTLKETTRDAPAEKMRRLQRAYELGERRETMLLAHRDWAAMDEGLYAYTNDAGNRQWHAAVKQSLNIDRPTALTKAKLSVTTTKL